MANDIYLNTVAQNNSSFDNTQLANLFQLAFLCPLRGGEAVFKARSMLSLVMDTVYYDDTLCAAQEEQRMHRNKADTAILEDKLPFVVKMYPNPAKDEINLAFFAQTEGQVKFEMTDQLGEMIKIEKMSEGVTFAKYPTGAISSGIYSWD